MAMLWPNKMLLMMQDEPTDLHLLLLPIVLIGPMIILLPMPRMGQLHLQWLLQIASLGPIIVLVDAADTLEWAHCSIRKTEISLMSYCVLIALKPKFSLI